MNENIKKLNEVVNEVEAYINSKKQFKENTLKELRTKLANTVNSLETSKARVNGEYTNNNAEEYVKAVADVERYKSEVKALESMIENTSKRPIMTLEECNSNSDKILNAYKGYKDSRVSAINKKFDEINAIVDEINNTRHYPNSIMNTLKKTAFENNSRANLESRYYQVAPSVEIPKAINRSIR